MKKKKMMIFWMEINPFLFIKKKEKKKKRKKEKKRKEEGCIIIISISIIVEHICQEKNYKVQEE
jgi:hypothetical protein